MNSAKNKIVALAYSGGLDTSFCVKWLAEQGWNVHAVTVNTGGQNPAHQKELSKRALSLGATGHELIDARAVLADEFLKYLIYANALRGEVYPLCVSVERVAQAKACAEFGKRIGAVALAHGSTGAGNDQVRFDSTFRCIAPELDVLTPVRSLGWTREKVTAWLAERGIEIPKETTSFSVNEGIWGATIGGGPTHESDKRLPDEAWVMTANRADWPDEAEILKIGFSDGIPVSINDESLDLVLLIEQLNERAGRHGIGRGMHLGDTILGLKGRVAFEAPAATVLISAHRELEKLVLSRSQQTWKKILGDLYATMVHESRYFDPLARNIEAFLRDSQARVSGSVTIECYKGLASVVGASSPHSILDSKSLRYGESSTEWSGEGAAAFCRIYGLADEIFARRDVLVP